MLRDYQQELLNKIKQALLTYNGVCGVMPCRSGKSYVMREICSLALKKYSNVLILAHRNILLEQHKKIIDLPNTRINSVFTEVNHLGEYERPDLIIIDEAHLSGANSYKKVCEYYGCKVIGFTATPCRLDGKPLDLFQKLVVGISANELIDRGDIADYDLFAPKIDINLQSVKLSGADYNSIDLGELMCDRKIYGDIIKNYKKYANGKNAIAYCVNVKHSKEMCKLFNDNGITAVHIDSTTSLQEREQAMKDFEKGKFKILCNCNLISEGITLPNCECCLLLRPTQSLTLYIQQANRCLTPQENKRAVIIDYVGNCFAHGMPTDNFKWSLTKTIKPRNKQREKDVLIRICKHCYRAYPSNLGAICPYCKNNNGKTKREIEKEQEIELERIKKIEKRKQGMARNLDSLIKLGKDRGYKSPYFWAKKIIESRGKKRK